MGLTRQEILRVARAIVEEDGVGALSVRNLGARLEVTAPALYAHVENKAEIVRALAAQGYDEMSARREVDRPERPIDRVRKNMCDYIAFAADNPELFRLMFMFRPAALDTMGEFPTDGVLDAAGRAFEEGLNDVAAAVADGDLVGEPLDLGLAMWAATHGVATAHLLMGASADRAAAGRLTDRVVNAMLKGLAT